MQQAGLCPWAPLSTQPFCTAVLRSALHSHPAQPSSGPVSSVLPRLQPLLCSPAALQLCHHVVPRALGRALYIESSAMYCPQVCSELVNQGQVRILATGTLILSTVCLHMTFFIPPRLFALKLYFYNLLLVEFLAIIFP